MYIAVVPNRNSPPAILLRESYRQQGRVKNRTLANLSHWPPGKIEALRQVLKGAGSVGPELAEAFAIARSRPHGHVAAVLGTIERLGLPPFLDRHNDRVPDYPGEQLIVCRNPLLAADGARKRQELLGAAEQKLDQIVCATQRPRRALKSPERIHYRVGRALAASKMAKYFSWQIPSEGFRYQRRQERIAQDAALDRMYGIRTSVSKQRLSAEQTVRTYKRLATLEGTHVLICLLAYHVEWHMRGALAPLLFDDEQPDSSSGSPVAPAQRSPAARAKALRKRTPNHLPVQSFADWLRDLATIVKNRIEPKLKSIPAFDRITRPTEAQRRALELLQVSL